MMFKTTHLATFNVFREKDGSLWVTVVEANGVAKEIHTEMPIYPFAMNALYEAVRQMQDRNLSAKKPSLPNNG
jgi:hypothetical protein